MRIIAITAIAVLLGACTGVMGPEDQAIACAEQRPQVCTMEYNPSCGVLIAGGKRDYASPCNACADDAVSAYLPGACPEPE
jgi:hypothetical protein